MQSSPSSSGRKGSLLLLVVFLIAIAISVLASVTASVVVEIRSYRAIRFALLAGIAGDSGVEDVVYRVRTGKLLGTTETVALGRGTSTMAQISGAGSSKEFYIAGTLGDRIRRTYVLADRTVTPVQIPYAIQADDGGVTLSNNAVVQGSIYANGPVVGVSGASITGNVVVSSGIRSDNIASSTTCTINEVVGRAHTAADYAERFTATSSGPLAKVNLYLKRNGSPSAATLRVVPDNAGVPGSSTLASASVPYTLVGTNYAWTPIAFPTPPALSGGANYWLLWDGTKDVNNWWRWCRSGVRDPYAVTNTATMNDYLGVVLSVYDFGSADGGDWVKYERMDFGAGATSITLWIGVPPANAGRQVQYRLDSPTGPIVGTLTVPATSDWGDYQPRTTTLTGVSGIHDFYMTFPSGYGAGSMSQFQFNGRSAYSGTVKAKHRWDWTNGSSAWNNMNGDMTFESFWGNGTESKIQSVSVGGIAKADSIISSTITGNAYFQILSGSTVFGTQYPGSPTPPRTGQAVATSTITSWKNDATAGGITTGNVVINGTTQTLGPRKIIGDLTVQNNGVLTITGTVWVTGKIVFSNNAVARCSASMGSSSCAIIADGAIDVANNGVVGGSGTTGSYLFLVSLSSCNGTTGTNCATGTTAINMNNNAGGSVVLAPNGLISISNNAGVAAASGWKVVLGNNGSIQYSTALSAATLTTGASGGDSVNGWSVTRWTDY